MQDMYPRLGETDGRRMLPTSKREQKTRHQLWPLAFSVKIFRYADELEPSFHTIEYV